MKKLIALVLSLIMVIGIASIASAETAEAIPCTMFLDGAVGVYAEEDAYLENVEKLFYDASGILFDFSILGSSHEDSYSMIATKLAGGELDFVKSASPSYMQELACDGYFVALDDMFAEYGQTNWNAVNPLGWDYGRIDETGKTYLIPYLGDYSMYVCTWVRWDLFEKAGYTELPTKVSELIDMMYTVMEQNPELVGVTSRYPNWPWQHSFCSWYPYYPNEWSTRTCDDNGEPYECIYGSNLPMYFNDEGWIEWFKGLCQWYQDGLIHEEIWTMDQDQLNTLIAQDRVFVMTEGWSAGQTIADQKSGLDPRYPVEEGKEQDWRLLALVENDLIAEGAPMVWGSGLYGVVTAYGAITDSCACPEELVKFFDWCYSGEEAYRAISWGVEGLHWTWDDEEQTHMTGLKDEAGNGLCSGALSSTVGSFYDPYSLSKTLNYIGTEWAQVWGTKGVDWTAFYQDSGPLTIINNDTLGSTERGNFAGEMMVKMISGEIGVDEGLQQLRDGLKEMGWDEYWADYSAQYKEQMAKVWGEDYVNHK